MDDRIQDIYPLAPLQRNMLSRVLQAPAGATGEFCAQDVCDYTLEPMDTDVLRQAWQFVLDRHATLRTGFVWEGVPEPVQVVHEGVPVPLEVLDWSTVGESERQQRLESLLDADRASIVDLAKPPLLRVRIVELDTNRCWMVLTFHHICLDGWSIPIVLEEVQDVYDQLADGIPPVLPPTRPYRDFIHWVAGQDSGEADRFWREHLSGFVEPTALPVDRIAVELGLPDTCRLVLSERTTRDLIDLAQRARVTLSTVVQAGWALLLSRYCGSRDVVFGLTVSGRPAELSGMESIVGLFINILPLRTRVDENETLVGWLRDLQGTQVAMQQFSYTPLAQIHGASAVTSGRPLFDSILTFQNLPAENPDDEGRETDGDLGASEPFVTPPARCPLMLSVDLDEVLGVWAEFSETSFDRVTVERLLEQLDRVLSAVATHSGSRVGDIAVGFHA